MRRAATGAALLLLCAAALPAQRPPSFGNGQKHAHATVSPVSVSGTRATLLVTLAVDPGWHVSWRNPGETGLPTRLTWSLPSDVRMARETWPVPVVTRTSVGVTHTLEGTVPWLVEFAVGRAADDDRLVTLTLRYGICRDVCIPEQLVVQGVLPGRRSATVAPVPAALRSRLVREAGTIAARRWSDSTLCLASAPLTAGTGVPDVIADSGLGLDAAVRLQRVAAARHHVFVMNTRGNAPLRTGSTLLFVRNADGALAQLDFARRAPGCRAR